MKAVDEQEGAVVRGAAHPDTSRPSGALTPKNLAASELSTQDTMYLCLLAVPC